MRYQIRLGKKPTTKKYITDEELLQRLDEKGKWIKELLEDLELTEEVLNPDRKQE